jgi:release factor glutamine methyltransferase
MREQGRPCNLVMTESDPAAAAYARENLERFALNSTTQLMIADLFPPLPDNPAGLAHLIVANPPYIPANQIDNLMPEVSIHEPRLALDGGVDGLDFYRRIIGEAPQFLKVGGWLLLEHGFDQAEQVDTLLRSAGCFENMATEMDYGGNPRVSGGRFRPDHR